MAVLVAKRLLLALLVALTVSIIAFTLLRLSGDIAAAVAGSSATSADIEFIRRSYAFDRPLIPQYLEWLGRVLAGDLGQSLYFRQDVASLLLGRMPVTLLLGSAALLLALLVGVPLGVIAAARPNSWIDRAALLVAVIGQTVPSFVLSLVLIMVFAVHWQIFPVSGSSTAAHLALPTIVLAIYAMPALLRLTRAGMIDVLAADYVRTARAKGLSPASVLFKHALRNAVMPVVALAAVQLGFLLAGSVIVESIFAIDGLGYLAWQSISRNDFPVTLAIVLLLSILYIALTLIGDLLNAWLDPRLRERHARG